MESKAYTFLSLLSVPLGLLIALYYIRVRKDRAQSVPEIISLTGNLPNVK